MQIDWLTVTAQIVNFLILVWLLKRFLYKPVVNAMARREERISARLREAEQREIDADERARDFSEQSRALAETREQHIQAAREAAEQEKRALLDEARREVDEQRERWQDELHRERRNFHRALERLLAESALRVSRRALADLADADLEHQLIAALLRRIEEMPDGERRHLTDAQGPVVVSASFELDDAARSRLRDALAGTAEVRFRHDPELAFGIVVSTAAHKLEWNVTDYLDDLSERIDTLLARPGQDSE
ncbi:MAG: hypothetical protein PVI56_12295 [Gammaproteobacteria bacterium]|jgi:F-type H+-transporting ATPase subunit b